jgi:formimidoylglutamate deiminase
MSVDLDDPHLAGLDDSSLLAGIIFSGDSRAVQDVMVGGKWVVRDGTHVLQTEAVRAFSRVVDKIYS